MTEDIDRDLLFGALALQACLIEAAQLAEACADRASGPEFRLADMFVLRGWLTEDERREVERLAWRVIGRHGGDARAALSAVAGAEVRDAIHAVNDAAVRNRLSSLPPATGYVLVETLLPTVDRHAAGAERPSRPRYTLTRLHAEGGLGKVWLARDHDLNREVALKEIRPARSGHPEMWRRFLKEAQVTGQLEHPNIVPVYELARRPEDDQPFYTMRFVRGRTFRRAIAEYHEARIEGRADPLDRPRLLQAFLGVCQAIAYAHSRGVIHRDLKPENVILGGFGEVIVLDWGLAKMVDQVDEPAESPGVDITEQARTDATRAGLQLGTPAYMAPEQAEGRLDLIDARTDIYGLGAMLFEILSGRPPHVGDDSVGLLERIVAGESPRARAAEPSVPPALDAVSARAMAKARDARYQKAGELADDIQRWLADEPVTAYTEGWRPRLARWARHHRALVQASTAVGVVVLLFSVLYAYQQGRTNVQLKGYAEAVTKAQAKTVGALKVAETERDNAGREARRALQSLSDLNRERGLGMVESGDGRGLLWLAQAVENTPADDADRQAANRTNLSSWGRSVHPLKAAFENPSIVALSPDGKTILTGGWDGVAQLRSVADGSPIGRPMKHAFAVTAAAFSPDGKTLVIGSNSNAFAGDEGNTARLWNVADGTAIGQRMAHESGFRGVEFSPDGKVVATWSWDKSVGLWNASDGTPSGLKIKHPDVVLAFAFSADGKTILTGCNDGFARLWNVADGTPVGKPILHMEPQSGQTFRMPVTAVAFGPDGKTLMTFCNSAEPRIWKTADGSPVVTIKNEKFTIINGAALSPDGKTVVTGLGDRTARVYRADNGLAVGAVMTHPAALTSVAYSPDGKTILTGSEDKTARLWSAADGTPIGSPMYHPSRVYPVRFSPDGRTILTFCQDKSARLWDAVASTDRSFNLNMVGVSRALAISPDGELILAHDQVGLVRCWKAADGEPVGRPFFHPRPVDFAAFGPDGRTVMTRCEDAKVRLWNVADGTPIGAPIEDKAMGNAAALSPDGRVVLTTFSFGRPFRLWNAADGTPLDNYGPPDQRGGPIGDAIRPGAVAFSPDGERVLAGYADRVARFLHVVDGKPVGPTLQHQDAVQAVAFSPDGKVVATGSADRTARLWVAADGSPIGNAMAHREAVTALAFSPDGRILLTGCSDRTARFWNASDGSPLSKPIVQGNPVAFVGFLPDGRRAVVSGLTVRIHEVPGAVEGTPRRLTLWAQVATNMELLGDRNVIRSLDPKIWEDRRRQLLDAGGFPGAFASPPAVAEWHRAQALDARQAGQWFAMHWHLERLILSGEGTGPDYAGRGLALIGLRRRDEAQVDLDRALQLGADSSEIRGDRGSTHAMKGRWKAAVDDLARAVELQPDDYALRLRHALALLGADDVEGYRRACVAMLDRLGDRQDPSAILASTAACNIVPGSVPDVDRIVRMADNPQMILFCQSHVAALYRAGRFQECIAKLDEAAKKGVMKSSWDQLRVANEMNRPLSPEYQELPGVNNFSSGDLYYAAMALQRLGRGDEARQLLDAASKHVDAIDKAAAGAIWSPWWSWVAAHRLRREAEALIPSKGP